MSRLCVASGFILQTKPLIPAADSMDHRGWCPSAHSLPSQLQGSSSAACYFTVLSWPLTLVQGLLPHLKSESGDITTVTSLNFLPMYCKFPALHYHFSRVYVYVHTGTFNVSMYVFVIAHAHVFK